MSTTSHVPCSSSCEDSGTIGALQDQFWFSLATSWHLPVTRTSQAHFGGSDEAYAIPLSDGHHVLFTDSESGLLCMGVERSTGNAQRLARKFVFERPSVMQQIPESHPTVYAVARDLNYGARIVAAYGDKIFLYSVPVDALKYSTAEQEQTERMSERVKRVINGPTAWFVCRWVEAFGVRILIIELR